MFGGEKGRIVDRGSWIVDRLTRNDAIIDHRSSIIDLRGLRGLYERELPAQTPRMFVDGVLIFRSQRPEEERPDYVNERKDYRARAEYDDRMRGGGQGSDGGRSDHRHDDGRRRVGDRRELFEVLPLHAELTANDGHAYRDVEHAKAGGRGGGPFKPAEFDAYVKRKAGERYLRQAEFEAEVPEIGDRSHDRGGQYHLRQQDDQIDRKDRRRIGVGFGEERDDQFAPHDEQQRAGRQDHEREPPHGVQPGLNDRPEIAGRLEARHLRRQRVPERAL